MCAGEITGSPQAAAAAESGLREGRGEQRLAALKDELLGFSELSQYAKVPKAFSVFRDALNAIEALEAGVADLKLANRDCVDHFEQMKARAETAEAQLKTVLDRESATAARHDAKVEKLEARAEAAEAEVARLREALGQINRMIPSPAPTKLLAQIEDICDGALARAALEEAKP